MKKKLVVCSPHAKALQSPLFRKRVKASKKVYRRGKIGLNQALKDKE
jgi:hypothetical protein